jgi:hypothetical protein
MFSVKIIGQNQKMVQLQLALPDGAAGDEIVVTVDRKTGLPTLWESRLAGKPVLRLRFEDLRRAQGKPIWAKVIAEDGTGQAIERWELVSYAELKSEIPPLNEGWENCVVLDVREQERDDAPPFLKALQAIRGGNWESVDRAFDAALRLQPRQPLLSFLKAWNLAQRPRHEEQIVALLTDVAHSGAVDLVRNVADGAFLHLSARELYAVLLAIPERQRTAAEWDHLARLAARAGKPAAGLQHIQSAIAAAGPAGDSSERARWHVQLLLETKQLPAAVQLSHKRLARDDISAEEVLAMADLFSSDGAKQEARELVVAALAHKQAVGMKRQPLLARRAEFENGLARWRTLIEAASLLPADSKWRQSEVGQVLREMTQLEERDLAGPLAQETKDPQIAAALWFVQAENEVQRGNAVAAADICWKLYEERQLPTDRHGWFIAHLHAARQHERLIWFVEDRLRAGETIDPDELHTVVPAAYDALGRKDAANRARTQPRPPEPPKPKAGRGMMGGMGGGFF